MALLLVLDNLKYLYFYLTLFVLAFYLYRTWPAHMSLQLHIQKNILLPWLAKVVFQYDLNLYSK